MKEIASALMAVAAAITLAVLPTKESPPAESVEVMGEVSPDETVEHIAEPDEIISLINELETVATPETTAPETTEPETMVEYDPWEHIPLEADVRAHVVSLCDEKGIAPEIIFAMIWRESRYDADAIGDNGRAFGLLQIHPRWHQARMDRLGVTDLLDPIQNVTVGIDLLDELIGIYGDVAPAVVAYNKGHYNGAITSYAQDVLAEAERIDR